MNEDEQERKWSSKVSGDPSYFKIKCYNNLAEILLIPSTSFPIPIKIARQPWNVIHPILLAQLSSIQCTTSHPPPTPPADPRVMICGSLCPSVVAPIIIILVVSTQKNGNGTRGAENIIMSHHQQLETRPDLSLSLLRLFANRDPETQTRIQAQSSATHGR